MSAGHLAVGSATLGADAVSSGGTAPIVVTGTAQLGGQLEVADIFAGDGTYEIMRADSFQGTFDSVLLPDSWSWRIEGHSLLLTKGPVPVEATSWGRIKSTLGR